MNDISLYYKLFDTTTVLPNDILECMKKHFLSDGLMKVKLDILVQFVEYHKLNLNKILLNAFRYDRRDVIAYYREHVNSFHTLENQSIMSSFRNVPVKHVVKLYNGENRTVIHMISKNFPQARRDTLKIAVTYNYMNILRDIQEGDNKYYDELVLLSCNLGNLEAFLFLLSQYEASKFFMHLQNAVIISYRKGYTYMWQYLCNRYVLIVNYRHIHCLSATENGITTRLANNKLLITNVLDIIITNEFFDMVYIIRRKYVIRKHLFYKYLSEGNIRAFEWLHKEYYEPHELTVHSTFGLTLETVEYLYSKGFTINKYKGNDLDILKCMISNGFDPTTISSVYLTYEIVEYLYPKYKIEDEYYKFLVSCIDY